MPSAEALAAGPVLHGPAASCDLEPTTDPKPSVSTGNCTNISSGESRYLSKASKFSAHAGSLPGKSLPVIVQKPVDTNTARGRILIADDDILVRGSLAAVLECEGYAVDEAGDGREAVTRAIDHPPDLALLDLNMPQWDGWTALSQLRRLAPFPIVIITARPNQYEKAVQLRVDAFMEKPLNISVLVKAIKRLVNNHREHDARNTTDTNLGFETELLSSADF